MSNTIIQIKRSSSVSKPADGLLSTAEPAYSFLSDKLFIGNTTGSAIAIGGKFFIDTQNVIFDAVNAAYSQANTVSSDADEKANAAIITANAAFDAANSGYDKANSANVLAYQIGGALDGVNTTVAYANSAWDKANAANLLAYHVGGALDGVNTTVAYANSAWDKANAANLLAYEIGVALTGTNNNADFANTVAIAAFDSSNSVNSYSDSTYVKLTYPNQTITGNLAVTGSLVVSGNTYKIDANTLYVSDPLIYLAGNNYISDLVDIGFVANYVNTTGQNVHTGLFRSHVTKEYYLFKSYDQEPEFNYIDYAGNNFTLAVLNADIISNNLWVSGYNTAPWITASFDKGNAAHLTANAAFDFANAGQLTANAAYDKANAANLLAYHIGGALDGINVVVAYANSAWDKANSANLLAYQIGGALDGVNTTVAYANSAWDKANAANLLAYNTLQSSYNASNLSTGTVPSGRLTGSYSGITGVGTLVNGTWNADVIDVTYGGTGAATHTNNYVLLGNTSGAIKSVGSSTEGHVLQINSSNVPQFAMLDGGVF